MWCADTWMKCRDDVLTPEWSAVMWCAENWTKCWDIVVTRPQYRDSAVARFETGWFEKYWYQTWFEPTKFWFISIPPTRWCEVQLCVWYASDDEIPIVYHCQEGPRGSSGPTQVENTEVKAWRPFSGLSWIEKPRDTDLKLCDWRPEPASGLPQA